MLSPSQEKLKRVTDVFGAAIGLLAFGWLIALAIVVARLETGKSGLYRQARVGRHGRQFQIFKIRTMHEQHGPESTVTIQGDPRVTFLGRILRRLKIDELPQLINVLKGDMSLVGPRPDVPALAGSLLAFAPSVLSVRPGITGPASLKYRREEELLAEHLDPEWVNNAVIFADKTRINATYVSEYRWLKDWKYLWQTIFGGGYCCSHSELCELIADHRRRMNAVA